LVVEELAFGNFRRSRKIGDDVKQAKPQARWDLLLLLSLLLLILLYPVLDHGEIRRIILGIVLFVPVIFTTIRMSQINAWVWPPIVLMCCSFGLAVADAISPNRTLRGIKWGTLALFFGFSVVGLFRYLRNSRSIRTPHLLTAASIYLLLGMLWFALYSSMDVFLPGAFQHSASVVTDHQTELLYFSLVTLSTVGYGAIVPLHGEVRMWAALEGITGVLYIAITVALLVSSYNQRISPSEMLEGNNEIG
jgi:ion channel